MVLRQKLFARGCALAAFGASVWWLLDDRTPQNAALVLINAVWLGYALRGLIELRDNVIYRRGLVGWDKNPFDLHAMTKLSLRREADFRRFPLVLRVETHDEASFTLECWAWSKWRDLGHVMSHVARELNAQQDEVTRRRLVCTDAHCAIAGRATAIVGGTQAPPHRETSFASHGFWASVGIVAILFAIGFAFVFFGIWLKGDPEASSLGSLVSVGLAGGVLFGVLGIGMVLWDRAKND